VRRVGTDFLAILGFTTKNFFRVLGGVFIVRYLQGEIPGFFAIPAGVGDLLTGIFAPLVAYWLYSGKSYARGAAIAWNLFGMADLVDAVTPSAAPVDQSNFRARHLPVTGKPLRNGSTLNSRSGRKNLDAIGATCLVVNPVVFISITL
jgi:hypothetical protein